MGVHEENEKIEIYDYEGTGTTFTQLCLYIGFICFLVSFLTSFVWVLIFWNSLRVLPTIAIALVGAGAVGVFVYVYGWFYYELKIKK